MSKTQALLLEKRKNIQQLMTFSLQSTYNFDVMVCSELQEAKNIISLSSEIQLIIVGDIGDMKGAHELFEHMVDEDKDAAFIVAALEDELWPEYKGKNITAIIHQEDAIEPLNALLKNYFQIDEEFVKEEKTQVAFQTLEYLDDLNEDLFIKLNTGRYLKIFSEGDNVERDDVMKYQEKGVDHLWLDKEAAKWILGKIDQAMPILIKDENATVNISKDDYKNDDDGFGKIGEKKENSDDIPDIDVSRPFSFEEDFINSIHGKSTRIRDRLKKNKNMVKHFKKLKVNREASAFVMSRIGLICNITTCIANILQWGSEATYEKLIYVAHVHDVTLFSHPDLCKILTLNELESKKESLSLTKEDIELYMNHPQQVSDIISKDKRAPADADIIVLQHHEMPDQSGFPNKIHSQRIVPFASLLTVSIDFSQYILDNPKWTFDEYLTKARNRYKGINYNKIFRAIQALADGKRTL